MAQANFVILEGRGVLAVSGPDRRVFLQGLVSTKVEIAERPELAVAAVFGAGALAALGLSGEPGEARPVEGGVALVDPRLAKLGARIIMDRGRLARLGPELAAVDFAA